MTRKKYFQAFALLLAALVLGSCSNRKSYAELLTDENHATNYFLANHRVVGYEKRDSTFNFLEGANAPYYQLDEDGNVYMQVINSGTPGNRAKYDQLIYFRFTRYNLFEYVETGELTNGVGNDEDISDSAANFRYGNYSAQSSSQWGTGIQMALIYLNIDCEVNMVIKSQSGLYSEIANVQPYVYNIRYFKSQI